MFIYQTSSGRCYNLYTILLITSMTRAETPGASHQTEPRISLNPGLFGISPYKSYLLHTRINKQLSLQSFQPYQGPRITLHSYENWDFLASLSHSIHPTIRGSNESSTYSKQIYRVFGRENSWNEYRAFSIQFFLKISSARIRISVGSSPRFGQCGYVKKTCP